MLTKVVLILCMLTKVVLSLCMLMLKGAGLRPPPIPPPRALTPTAPHS